MDLKQLFADVARALQSELVGYVKLEGGSSADVWRLDLSEGDTTRSVVFRQHRAGELKEHEAGIAGKEFRLLGRLSELGLPVARPIHLDEQRRFLITEFVAGSATVDADAVGPAIVQMADLLARIHSIHVSLISDVGLAPLEDPIERLRTCLPAIPAGRQLESLLDTDQIAMHLNKPMLMHGDYWPGNVLWMQGKIAVLIDWEDACLGDPVADLACARVELLCQYGQAAMHDFTTHYLHRSQPIDIRSLPIWECYVSATALASMHLWELDPLEEARRRSVTEAFFTRATASVDST